MRAQAYSLHFNVTRYARPHRRADPARAWRRDLPFVRAAGGPRFVFPLSARAHVRRGGRLAGFVAKMRTSLLGAHAGPRATKDGECAEVGAQALRWEIDTWHDRETTHWG